MDEIYTPPPMEPVLLMYEDIFKATYVQGLTIPDFFNKYLEPNGDMISRVGF